MSKRDHWRQRYDKRKVVRRKIVDRKIVIAAGLVFSLLIATAALAFWPTSQKRRQAGGEIVATSLSPASPSKEYIYAGGRLVATEEPGAPTGSNNAAFVSETVPGSMRRVRVIVSPSP